jgi:hypothetical protein
MALFQKKSALICLLSAVKVLGVAVAFALAFAFVPKLHPP